MITVRSELLKREKSSLRLYPLPEAPLRPLLTYLLNSIVALCCASVSAGFAWGDSRLQSGNTIIAIEAAGSAPRLVSVCMRGAPCWDQETPEALISSLQSDGKAVDLHWKLNRAAGTPGRRFVRFVYDARTDDGARVLQLSWEWRVRGPRNYGGPIEHTIRIRNCSHRDVWIPLQPSAQMKWMVPQDEPLKQMWVEKGAGGPSAEGVHRSAVGEGYQWIGTSSTYAHPPENAQREMIPYLLMERPKTRSGWYLGIEFSGRTQIRLRRDGNDLRVSAGLNPQPGPFKTHLLPGEVFVTPAIFVGAFRGDEDAAGNQLRRWVRNVLNDPRAVRDPQYPLVVNNSWGSGMAVDSGQAHAMIRDSAELGFEMFHLDAGWFRGVGDWVPDRAKFPQGLAPIADDAHAHGLRFGLWMDWSQAGFGTGDGVISARGPKERDWLTTDPAVDYKPLDAFKGVTMDIGDPPVHQWVDDKLRSIVHRDHLDMLEHDGYVVAQGCERTDHPHAAPDPATLRRYVDSGFPWVDGSNSTDVSYHSTRAYYEIHDRLRRENPRLLLEICNDGGRMVDFGSAAHGDYFSISDAYDPLSNRRAFYDSSYMLPSAMLETYVEKWPAVSNENFLYVLRSGMMGWFTLMMDTRDWTREQRAVAKTAIQIYKDRLRPLIRSAELFHVSPRPDGVHWDGIEYVDRNRRCGVLFAFRGSGPLESTHTFFLRGLESAARYRIEFQDRTSPDSTIDGRTLQHAGVQINLPHAESSELMFFEKIDR